MLAIFVQASTQVRQLNEFFVESTSVCRSGHKCATVLLPGFAIIS